MFQKTKQKLIKNNQIGKYLRYALGEIILVMLGILLALQVNNRNENGKDREKEKVILSELNKDFEQNLQRFKEIKQMQFNTYNSGVIVFRNLDKLHIPASRDSVYRYVTGMFGGYSYYPSNGVVESLINSGEIRLIKNDTLRNYLVSWKDVLNDYTERVDIDIKFWSNQIEPYVIEHGNFYHVDTDENKSLVEDREFINMLVRKQHYNRNLVSAIQNEDGIERYMNEIIRLTQVQNDKK
ncbi:MAG: hypothetical protein KDD31_04855 [Muricauda sp.]|nr:hypothetical protein [Allomuricauda sp.]